MIRFFFSVFLLISFLISSVLSASPKTIKALESCSDSKWDEYQISHRDTFEKTSLSYQETIQSAKDSGHDNIVEYFTQQLEAHNKAGKKAYNVVREFQTNFTKQKLKKKIVRKFFL